MNRSSEDLDTPPTGQHNDQIQQGHGHFHQHSPSKLEKPERVRELNPSGTLQRLGFADGQVLCDIGAGSGLFTIAAAELSRQTVFALEINPVMLEAIAAKATAKGLDHIQLLPVVGESLPVPNSAVDLALLVTVLHEISGPDAMLAEIRRLLKPGGRLAVIEFQGRETPMGPPLTERLSTEAVIRIVTPHGFVLQDQFDLGPNLYAMVLSITDNL
jgi:SAM-dependent methyltransferase